MEGRGMASGAGGRFGRIGSRSRSRRSLEESQVMAPRARRAARKSLKLPSRSQCSSGPMTESRDSTGGESDNEGARAARGIGEIGGSGTEGIGTVYLYRKCRAQPSSL
jgi:hypothetical protein